MKRSSRAKFLFFIYLGLAGCVAREGRVAPRQAAAPAQATEVSREGRSLFYSSTSDDLNYLQEYFHPSLKANEKEFHGRVNLVRGFGAGASYPQIWLRDSATIIPVSRYYYRLEYLTSWLEEHLSHQAEDGSLYDWIAPGEAANFRAAAPLVREVYKGTSAGRTLAISADKNSSEADQETSAVDAAYKIFQITGDVAWLKRSVGGQALLARLDRSLEYLLARRQDAAYGLITNAFTADWGDVTPTYPDQRAIYLDAQTPMVVSLYTNALFYRAATQMGELHEAAAGGERAAYWRARAASVKESVNKHLWQEARGFYRIHLTLTPELAREAPDDSDIFALGGNALAALYGVADDRQVKRIFEVADERQRQFKVSTIGASLLPPYPAGFFKHPAVSQQYFYQNGGQWDWFAGRFLLAEFERGYAWRAYRQLLEVARKDVRNNGLYEWDTRTGEARGSVNYAGSAGALGQAVIEGLFGVYLRHDTLDLRIRLGERPGKITLRQPSNGSRVTYDYSYDVTQGLVKLSYESNVNRAGKLCILLPAGLRATMLLLDGSQKGFTEESVGEDRYACAPTDWKSHRVELRVAR